MITANQHPSYSYLAEMNKDAVIFPSSFDFHWHGNEWKKVCGLL